MFETMTAPKPDSLVEIGRLFRADNRDNKIDLGVGTYRNAYGHIEVMSAVREAECWHFKAQTSKGYLGPGGDARFCALLMRQLFPGLAAASDGRLALVQTPGGTGAYRLGLELAARQAPDSTLIVGTPTWPNHVPIAERVGLSVRTYRYYDFETGAVDFDAMLSAIASAKPGDLFLVHGCCHNPTGAALTPDQWVELTAALFEARLVPVIDLAYAGMARGLAEDTIATRRMLDNLPEAIVAISCSKSFGLYSDRTGMLAVLASAPGPADVCQATSEALARNLWSNPPDHGAAIVRGVLDNEVLKAQWRHQLERMRFRLIGVRKQLAASGLPGTEMLRHQEGLFALLPLDPATTALLREKHAIYMDPGGRINIAGLNDLNMDRFLAAYEDVARVAEAVPA